MRNDDRPNVPRVFGNKGGSAKPFYHCFPSAAPELGTIRIRAGGHDHWEKGNMLAPTELVCNRILKRLWKPILSQRRFGNGFSVFGSRRARLIRGLFLTHRFEGILP